MAEKKPVTPENKAYQRMIRESKREVKQLQARKQIAMTVPDKKKALTQRLKKLGIL